MKGVRSRLEEDSEAAYNNLDERDDYGPASPVAKRSSKEQRPAKISKSEVFVPITPKIVDDGPTADWVKINVHRTVSLVHFEMCVSSKLGCRSGEGIGSAGVELFLPGLFVTRQVLTHTCGGFF